MNKKRWYDYLWIFSTVYLILGFFNILFAWLGLICFFTPLAISLIKGNKAYCNKYCGRGQLFSLLGGRFGLSRKKDVPRWMKSPYFRYGFLIFFLTMFSIMIWNTYLVYAGTESLKQIVTLLWTFKVPWQWAYHGTLISTGTAHFRFLQRDADINFTRSCYYDTLQTTFLVRLLPHGNHDTNDMQNKST